MGEATILHAEYHRPPANILRDRFALHYTDFAALWRHPGGLRARTDFDLLARVATYKSRFFRSTWASYATAQPGTLHLVPRAEREAELKADLQKMRAMFLTPPPELDDLLGVLHEALRSLRFQSTDVRWLMAGIGCKESSIRRINTASGSSRSGSSSERIAVSRKGALDGGPGT